MNLFVVILVSGAVGFLAGQFFSSGSGRGAAPVSLKEAVTGDVDVVKVPAIVQPARERSAGSPGVPAKTLREQFFALGVSEMRKLCADSERDWYERHVNNYAPRPQSAELHSSLRELRENLSVSRYWFGQGSIGKFTFEVILSFEDARDKGSTTPGLTVSIPTDLCHSITAYFVVDGKPQSAGSMGSCGTPFRKRGEYDYLDWPLINQEEIRPFAGAILFPVPSSRPGPLEYLDTATGKWIGMPNFRWRTATYGEVTSLRKRFETQLNPENP